jgi:UDP-glucose 4-epimerase
MKILVTGGAGFIGSHLVEALDRLGHSVCVVDNLSTGLREQVPAGVPLATIDVRDRDALAGLFARERPDAVFHLAGQMNVRTSLWDPAMDAEVNVLGSLSVFKNAIAAGARRIVFASSGGAVYGEQPKVPCRESALPSPASPYGISKLAGEHYGRQLCKDAGVGFVALRLANVYGPRQNPKGEAGVVALFLSELLSGRSSKVFGDGTQTRDFIWVGDVVNAFLEAMDAPPGIYNIGTGVETRIRDLYERLEVCAGTFGSLIHVAHNAGEVRRNALSCERARDSFGWTPQMKLEDGLRKTAAFYKAVARESGSGGGPSAVKASTKEKGFRA